MEGRDVGDYDGVRGNGVGAVVEGENLRLVSRVFRDQVDWRVQPEGFVLNPRSLVQRQTAKEKGKSGHTITATHLFNCGNTLSYSNVSGLP